MTPDSLYAALDEPNADIVLILGQIADWYEERGETWKAECLQWCRREGKRPEPYESCRYYRWWMSVPPANHVVGFVLGKYIRLMHGEMRYDKLRDAYANLADAWHALRTRGEVPVAGINSERMVTT